MQLCAESVQFALLNQQLADAREKEEAGASVINFAHVIPRNAAGCWRSEMRTGRLIARRAGGSACVLRGVNACRVLSCGAVLVGSGAVGAVRCAEDAESRSARVVLCRAAAMLAGRNLLLHDRVGAHLCHRHAVHWCVRCSAFCALPRAPHTADSARKQGPHTPSATPTSTRPASRGIVVLAACAPPLALRCFFAPRSVFGAC